MDSAGVKADAHTAHFELVEVFDPPENEIAEGR